MKDKNVNDRIREQQWVLKKTRQILRESGVRSARRFIESRGGTARHEVASREIARVERAQQHKETQKEFSSPTTFVVGQQPIRWLFFRMILQ